MKGAPIPTPTSQQLYNWAIKLTNYLQTLERSVENVAPKVVQLEHAKSTAKATTDGLMMWDSVSGCPIVAKNGAWYKVEITPLVMVGITDRAAR
jgi:hypothetical protein